MNQLLNSRMKGSISLIFPTSDNTSLFIKFITSDKLYLKSVALTTRIYVQIKI